METEIKSPFGEEWEKYIMSLTKRDIMELYKRTCIKLQSIEQGLDWVKDNGGIAAWELFKSNNEKAIQK